MPEPFHRTLGQLSPHWNNLGKDLAKALDTQTLALVSAPAGPQLVATLAGDSVRRAGRLRGDGMLITPYVALSHNWEAWLGYREVWRQAEANQNRFNFSSADLTVYITQSRAEAFQQILRAEWSGVERGKDDEWVFRPDDAGHPHWQIDIAETLRTDQELEAARALLQESRPRTFGEEEFAPKEDIPPWYQLGRMHFASAMRPWADGNIAHGPRQLVELRDWALATVRLLRLELCRL